MSFFRVSKLKLFVHSEPKKNSVIQSARRLQSFPVPEVSASSFSGF